MEEDLSSNATTETMSMAMDVTATVSKRKDGTAAEVPQPDQAYVCIGNQTDA